MAAFRRIDVKPIAGTIGAEIEGVDIGKGVEDETIAEIRQALLDHLVIFFRDQDFDDAAHITFTRQFGDIFIHPNYTLGQKDPEIVRLVRAPGDNSVAGEDWHADTTMMAEPPMGAILFAHEVPPYGSDTLFANQYLAYETLSDGLKSTLADLRAVHSDIKVAGPQAAKNSKRTSKVREDSNWQPTESVHPVVRTHPETGRKCLFVNYAYTTRFEGMTEQESQPLLDYLLEHGNRPEFSCRFVWRPGSIAFWDNRCAKHIALNDNNLYPRRMRRTQICGDRVY